MNKTIDDNYPEISVRLLKWYDHNRRNLPWRALPGEKSNPYYVLLSEIMLQQTIVATVIPYFLKFIKKWPTINHLAQANFSAISNEWSGLGYYRRAKNLHETAKIISVKYNGCIPDNTSELLTFPGIGNYTAAAITAIAFNSDENVVDGNIERIFSRLYRIEKPLELSKDRIKKLSAKHVPNKRNGDYAQALMDLDVSSALLFLLVKSLKKRRLANTLKGYQKKLKILGMDYFFVCLMIKILFFLLLIKIKGYCLIWI